MAGETDEARPAVEPLRRMLDLAAVEGVDVDIEDLRAVERDLDLLAVDVDLLEIPLAHGPEVAVLGGDAVVEAAVILVGLEARLACRSLLFVVAIPSLTESGKVEVKLGSDTYDAGSAAARAQNIFFFAFVFFLRSK